MRRHFDAKAERRESLRTTSRSGREEEEEEEEEDDEGIAEDEDSSSRWNSASKWNLGYERIKMTFVSGMKGKRHKWGKMVNCMLTR